MQSSSKTQCMLYFIIADTAKQVIQHYFHIYSKRAILQTKMTNTPYFLAKEILMAVVGVILKPWRASLAAADCISVSNSTNAMSCLPGTNLTSLNPGNWKKEY